MISEARISVDTQSALLLSASLGKRTKDGPAPLTAVEYRELVAALFAEGLRPGDLLQVNAAASISALLSRFPERMRQRVTYDRLARLLDRGGQLAFALARWTSAGVWVASRADENYPSRYKKKLGRSAPPLVYGIGPAPLLERGGLAVVGSRKPDESSEKYTTFVGSWAASAGVQIVSGAARGVDEGSMISCVNAGGTALGIVADSLLKLSMRRDFREAILAENLTLISSFDPDAGFSVPNAMARNRWIYALADRALVVACSEGRGGTWAGAVEALKHGVSLYVRTGNPARPGNEALVVRGAMSAPADLDELWKSDTSAPQPFRSSPNTSLPLSLIPQDGDAYVLVAPLLLHLLVVPMDAKQLAASAGLTKSQTDAWLRRLIAEGRVKKVKATYRAMTEAAPSTDQPTLF